MSEMLSTYLSQSVWISEAAERIGSENLFKIGDKKLAAKRLKRWKTICGCNSSLKTRVSEYGLTLLRAERILTIDSTANHCTLNEEMKEMWCWVVRNQIFESRVKWRLRSDFAIRVASDTEKRIRDNFKKKELRIIAETAWESLKNDLIISLNKLARVGLEDMQCASISPVLIRLLFIYTQDWLGSTTELIARILDSCEQSESIWNNNRVTMITRTSGDIHDGGSFGMLRANFQPLYDSL